MGIFRLFLALSVVLVHSQGLKGLMFFSGSGAVKLFFALSGFYMTLVLSTKYKSDLRDFYCNRALRIYPIYLLVLVLDLVSIRHDRNIAEWHTLDWPGFLYVAFANIFLFGLDWMYFLHADANGHFLLGPNETVQHFYGPAASCFTMEGQAWTLGLECTFYLIVPLLVKLRTRWLIALLVGLFYCKYIFFKMYGTGMHSDAFGFRFFPFELPFFLSGMVAYRTYNYIKSEKKWLYLYLVGIPLLWTYIFFHSDVTLGEISLSYCGLICFIPLLFLITKNSRIDALFGAFSYPVYISHFLVSRYMMQSHPHVYETFFGFGGMVIMLTMAFSIMLIKADDLLHLLKRDPGKAPVTFNEIIQKLQHFMWHWRNKITTNILIQKFFLKIAMI